MDRLLTKDEIEALDGRQNMVAAYEDKVVAKAQDAKSVKIDRQAAAGWFMGICSEHKHAPLEHRIDCDECICELPELLREGKAPWEKE